MVGGILIAVILVIMAGAHIATTLTTAKELDTLRKTVKKLSLEIHHAHVRATSLQNELSSVSAYAKSGFIGSVKNTQKMSGELDIYHGGQAATVQAVFRPRQY